MEILSLVSQWTPTLTPLLSTFTSIATSHVSDLSLTLVSAASRLATETYVGDLLQISKIVRGAEASLTVISAEQVIVTAAPTATALISEAKQAIFMATLNLEELADENNLFSMELNFGGNLFFTIIFALLLVAHTGLGVWSRNIYMLVCLFCCCGLEVCGYLGRVLAVNDTASQPKFLDQIVTLTIAPAFVAAGIYFYFGQSIITYGTQNSIMRPTWYTYIFVCCDIVSLLVQAGGGAAASIAVQNNESADPGTWTMLAGVAFQVFTMTFFISLYFDFLHRIYFRKSPEVKFSIKNIMILLLNLKGSSEMREKLEPYYEPEYAANRKKLLFKWVPIGILTSTIFVYVRCIYRVVEMAEGWSGYLITHEVFLFVLDATMMFFACFILALVHPKFTLSKAVSFKEIRSKQKLKPDVETEEKSTVDNNFSESKDHSESS